MFAHRRRGLASGNSKVACVVAAPFCEFRVTAFPYNYATYAKMFETCVEPIENSSVHMYTNNGN